MLAYEEWDDIIYHCPTAETFESKTGAGKNNWWDVVSVNQDCPGQARMEGKLTLERSKALELGPMSLDLCPSSISLCSVQFSPSVVSDSLQPHGLWHARPPCPSPTPGVYPNSCPLSQWYHPTISTFVIPFSACPQSFPTSGSFKMSQFFTAGGQSTGVSASTSVLPMNTQDWTPLGLTCWISLQSKGLSRVFSNTTVQKHQFFGAQLSL